MQVSLEKLALAVSVVALLVSALSWWESRRVRMVTQATSRASVHASAAKITEVLKGGIEIQITFTNVGNATAKDIVIRPGLMSIPDPANQTQGNRHPVDERDPVELDDMPPHTSQTKTLLMRLPENLKPDWPTFIGVFLGIKYTDEATGEQFDAHNSYTSFLYDNKAGLPDMVFGTIPPHSAFSAARDAATKKGGKNAN